MTLRDMLTVRTTGHRGIHGRHSVDVLVSVDRDALDAALARVAWLA